MVTNNGYRSASVRVQSNVTNTDWMNQSSIRIEVEGASGTGIECADATVEARRAN